MPTINPQSLAALKRLSVDIPGTEGLSPDVLAAAPDLSLDTPHTAAEAAGNERLKQMLGLGERSPQFKQQEADLALRDKALNEAHVAQIPEVAAESDKAYQEKLGVAGEGARVAGEQAQKLESLKHEDVMKFLGGDGSGGAGGGISANDPSAPFKMSIGANGEPSFAPNPMPALVQRAHNQLSDALSKTQQALQDAEKMYPGITAAAQSSASGNASPGWMSFLSGNAGKYGGVKDLISARNERAKYSLGIPTPFADLAQSASFGNIEQMAGQLPGVRGLATISPMFKEHQSRWGYETPLATTQRLLGMRKLMYDSLSDMEKGGGQHPATASPSPDPYANSDYQPR